MPLPPPKKTAFHTLLIAATCHLWAGWSVFCVQHCCILAGKTKVVMGRGLNHTEASVKTVLVTISKAGFTIWCPCKILKTVRLQDWKALYLFFVARSSKYHPHNPWHWQKSNERLKGILLLPMILWKCILNFWYFMAIAQSVLLVQSNSGMTSFLFLGYFKGFG